MLEGATEALVIKFADGGCGRKRSSAHGTKGLGKRGCLLGLG